MWIEAYATTNLRAVDNPHTPGQCGGMCALWLANMYNRAGKTLAQTRPNSRVATDTHLAGLRVPEAQWKDVTGHPRIKRASNLADLPTTAANARFVAAAGMTSGPVKRALRTNLGNWLAQSRSSGGNFIDIGGHAVATFVNWKRLAPYEKKRRLYFFDPNHGCYYSENELTFNGKFAELVQEHTGRNRLFQDWWWSYFKVFEVGNPAEDDSDTDIGSLFG